MKFRQNVEEKYVRDLNQIPIILQMFKSGTILNVSLFHHSQNKSSPTFRVRSSEDRARFYMVSNDERRRLIPILEEILRTKKHEDED